METSTTQGQDRLQEHGIVLHDTYRLVRQLGFGGMGVVYEGVHTRLPRRFAIKVLLRSLLSNPEAHARFCREAEIMSQLRHPHIVQIFDFNVTHENQPYFVMEYLEGRDLDAELADSAGGMPIARVVPIIDAIASALTAAHRRGIVHRDLKPSNVFLCDVDGAGEGGGDGGGDGEGGGARAESPFVKVLDFGVSKVRSAGRITLGAKMIGTPNYMAPEQATGHVDQVDGRADQFALAAITYEMLTGHDAFAGEDMVAVLYQIVHEHPQPLGRYVGWNCAGVQQVLSRALCKDPALRFSTIADFSYALGEAAQGIHEEALYGDTVQDVDYEEANDNALGPDIVRPAGGGRVPALLRAAAGPGAFGDEITETIPRVARMRYRRPVVLSLVVSALIALGLATGWAHQLPDQVLVAAHALKTRMIGGVSAGGPRPPALPPTIVRESAPPAPRPLPFETEPLVVPTAAAPGAGTRPRAGGE